MKLLICFALLSIKYCFCISGKIWDKQKNDFVDIFSIKEFKYFHELHEKRMEESENHKFNGEIVSLIANEIGNHVEFKDDCKKVTGIDGDIWTTLSEYLNFTLSLTIEPSIGLELPNGSFTGSLGKVQRHEFTIRPHLKITESRARVGFTVPFRNDRYRFFARLKKQFKTTWLFDVFSGKTWCVIVLFYVLMSVSSIVVRNIAYWKKFRVYSENPTAIDYFFYNFGVFCNQGGALYKLQKMSKILSFCGSMFSWFLLTSFSSQLIAYIAQTIWIHPFENYEMLYYNTNYTILTLKENSIHNDFKTSNISIYKDIQNAGRFQYFENEDEAVHLLCSNNPEYTMIRDEFSKFHRSIGCEVQPVGEILYSTWASTVIDKTYPFKRSFDVGIIKLRESGIIQALKTRWLRAEDPNRKVETAYAPITLEQVSLLIYIYIFGLILSIIILFIEILVYNIRHKR